MYMFRLDVIATLTFIYSHSEEFPYEFESVSNSELQLERLFRRIISSAHPPEPPTLL